MPFEIKTGRNVAGMEHRAQTMLYTLLVAERYGVEVPSGLLYYTQSEEVVRVPQSRNELRALIGARNEMASYMMRRNTHGKEKAPEEPFLPPTIDDERACNRCYALDTCMLFRKVWFLCCCMGSADTHGYRLWKTSLIHLHLSQMYTHSKPRISSLLILHSLNNGRSSFRSRNRTPLGSGKSYGACPLKNARTRADVSTRWS
jgi:hypothetical protein